MLPAEVGETLFTSFEAHAAPSGPVWTLKMGALNDSARVSSLTVPAPYMGLGKTWAKPSTRWDATNFSNMCINSCWELYGAKDLDHLPSSGSTYHLRVSRPPSATFPWVSKWDQDEGNNSCATSEIVESHNATTQQVRWDIHVPKRPFALSTNALFSDHMVLQDPRLQPGAPPTTLHGTAAPGAVVTLTGLPGGSLHAPPAAEDGSWALQLSIRSTVEEEAEEGDEEEARAGPMVLTLSSPGATPIIARDVLLGDVFLCSGQSNMERTVDYIINSTAELAAADHPNMRLFQVPSPHPPGPRGPWYHPSRELNGSCLGPLPYRGKGCTEPRRSWVVANSTFVAKFSAICYLTVRDAMRLIGHPTRPVGLIEDDWGGTPVQAWSTATALASCGMSPLDCPTEPTATIHGDKCTDYPSALFHHMLYPIVGYGLRAVLWMQGEANSNEGFPLTREEYACAFGAMIDSWRAAWRAPDLPFFWVQISAWFGNWGFDHLPCTFDYCPVITRIRLAQADVLTSGRAYVGMAVSHDNGDDEQHGVHSRYKSEPSRRLAYDVARVAYGAPLAAAAPAPRGSAVVLSQQGTRIKVAVPLEHATGLTLKPTTRCEVQYSKTCCGNSTFPEPEGPVLGRLCTVANASACTVADGARVLLANVSVDAANERIVFAATLAEASDTITFVDFALTDFPQCAVHNSFGFALGPFGPLPVAAATESPITLPRMDDGLAKTPPMGYRTWNDVHGTVNTTYIKQMVDAVTSRKRLVDGKPTSLLDLGYGRVGLDDGWQACGHGWAPPGHKPSFHAIDGTPLINASLFPSLPDMVAYGHSKGVKMDMYLNNCICMDEYTLQANASFAQRAYAGDIQMLLDSGFDGVKIDNCGDDRGAGYVARTQHLRASGKHLLIENSNQGFGNPWPSGKPARNPPGPPRENPPNRSVLPDYCPFHMFRTGGDIGPSFGNVMAKLHSIAAGQGCWAFPDMLEVGNFATGPKAFVEARTHFGAWSVVSSPLLLSTSLADDAVMDAIWPIVSNTEAISVNQMWHGHPGRLVAEGTSDGGAPWQCWAKAGPNGAQAVLLLNAGDAPLGLVRLELSTLGLSGVVRVRDIWAHKDVEDVSGAWEVRGVASHDSIFVMMTPK